MPKSSPSVRVMSARALIALIETTPEGFFHVRLLNDDRLGIGDRAAAIEGALHEGAIAREGDYLYDPERLSAEQVRYFAQFYDGALPTLKPDGTPAVRPVRERLAQRESRLDALGMPECRQLLERFQSTLGYLPLGELSRTPSEEVALSLLLSANLLKQMDEYVFDPLRITRPSLQAIFERHFWQVTRQELLALVATQDGQTILRPDLVERYGMKTVQRAVESGDLVPFTVKAPLGETVWLRLANADPQAALAAAQAAVLPKDEDWQAALDLCGDVLRQPNHDGTTRREKVLARSYSLSAASKKLGIRADTLQNAIGARLITAFIDPEGQTRLSAAQVNAIRNNPELFQAIEDQEIVTVRDLLLLVDGQGEQERLLRDALRKWRKDSAGRVRWGQARELLWDEPISLQTFREQLRAARSAWLLKQAEKSRLEEARRAEELRLLRQRQEEERRQQEELRARLLAAFPTWQHAGRADQLVLLHVGPTNSGKTYQALQALSAAGTGWYLAPLRLLAFEVFDRLNRDGVRCNLLTGEEHIEVEGATVTAATIEMFNPQRSGACVVIDEAHMLADPDRGWAWTRALMECRAPEIRVIAPPFAQTLIERLTAAALIPTQIIRHERLAPLQVATQPWSLEDLPPRTILVAFSRRMVLRLKTELERHHRRVSVIYGNLPPEVRRKQADRFADGVTEICIATDAVGMGLNLPADYVCFFELEKFDGNAVRPLSAQEVHQIAGRAGRYGLSQAGVVGATTRLNLKALQRLMATMPPELKRARVSPALEDLELIPGSLARRLARWRELQSIPDSLRDVIEPADIDERIALAAMLSDREVEQLGLAAAVQLINAPTREGSRAYWYACARAILDNQPMPLPLEPPPTIEDDHDLEATEQAISCADIYLWLACRPEFAQFAPDEPWLRALRAEWSVNIDAALLRRIDTGSRCANCRCRLPLNHRYALCNACYANDRTQWRSERTFR
ncbi:MAG: helicase-related protein [Anaerolineae bacterium]|nr:helicase-related protein [Anaerolineae bacterium]MDW8298422.1 helicase-related protein [Anaerolineae bacterium]